MEQGLLIRKNQLHFFANHPDNFAYADRENTWAFIQRFEKLTLGEWIDVSNSANIVQLPDAGHLFNYTGFGSTNNIGGFTTNREEGAIIYMKCTDGHLYYSPYVSMNTPVRNIQHPYTVSNGLTTGSQYWVRQGDVAQLILRLYGAEKVWELVGTIRGMSAQLLEVNEFTKQQRWAVGSTPVFSSNTLDLETVASDYDGNFYALNMAGTGLDSLKWMNDLPNGTVINVRFGYGCIITPDYITTPPTGFVKIVTYDTFPVKIPSQTVVKFIRESAGWNAVIPKVDKEIETVSYNVTGTGVNVYYALSPKTEYMRLVNNSTDRIVVKNITVQPWHKTGSMLTVEMSNRYNGVGSLRIFFEAKTGGNGGNISLGYETAGATHPFKVSTGSDTSSTAAKVFVTFMYNGTTWEEQYRSINYSV